MDFITRQLENKRLPFFNNSFGQTYISTDTRDRQKSFRNWMMRTWWPTRSRCVNVKEMAAFRCLSVESKNTDKDNVPTTTRIHKKDRGKTKSWQKKNERDFVTRAFWKKARRSRQHPLLVLRKKRKKKRNNMKGGKTKKPTRLLFFLSTESKQKIASQCGRVIKWKTIRVDWGCQERERGVCYFGAVALSLSEGKSHGFTSIKVARHLFSLSSSSS